MPKPKPTDSELLILRVLWDRGPSTVGEVLESVRGDREIGYTTVLKLLQIMHEKGLVGRDESARAHVYRAQIGEEQAQKHLLRDLVSKAFRGSSGRLAVQALSLRKTTPEERAEIRRLLDEAETGGAA